MQPAAHASAPASALTDTAALFDPTRLPGLSRAERALLRRMREHPHAPVYRHYSGHRLQAHERWQARARHAWVQHAAAPRWQPGEPLPGWVARFVAACAREVPAHARKALARGARSLEALPTMDRAALSARLAAHVPRHRSLERLICFSTSGTTGHPLRVPSHPQVACDYHAYHRRALAMFGLRPQAGSGEVGIVLAGFQQRCFTYVSVHPLHGCGLAKLNLNPAEWRHADDRAAYLDAMAPELISGDPVSLAELMRLPLQHRPRALLSTSMALSPALRGQLEARFASPVLDLYSMNEAGPVAVFVPRHQGFVPLQPRLLIEVVDAQGRALPPGGRGEITLTGGFNPWLPLLRYRTGDWATLEHTAHGLLLRELEGRAPVQFRDAQGRWFNNIEVTRALQPWSLTRYALHQHADGACTLRVDAPSPGPALESALRHALGSLLGPLPLAITPLHADDKVRQYTTDLPDPVSSKLA